jgi:PAS domain-containing protein
MSGPGMPPLTALCGLIEFLHGVKDADDDRVWARVLEKLSAALDCEASTYFVYLPKANSLTARAALGTATSSLQSRPVESGQGLCGWVAKYREPALVEDAYADPRFLAAVDEASGFKTKTVLAVPLFDRLELVGVLELINKRAGAFTPADLGLVQAACSAAALALRSLKLESTVDRVTAHNASILDNLGGGFVAVDVHGRMMLCNPAARRILDIPPEAPLNVPVDQALFTNPEMAEILMDTLVKKTTVKRQDLWWKRKGETRVLGYSTLLIQDTGGRVVGAGITFQDITSFQKKP